MLCFDIFCRVIDNFGDAGVCWRLANELSSAPYHARVRLWIDDMRTLQRITQRSTIATNSPLPANLKVYPWPNHQSAYNFRWPAPYPIIIEAFAGGIPEGIRKQLGPEHLWIVLDHLSAENWVEDFHGLPGHISSQQPQKYFFYPGFTENTGGLLRQPKLLTLIRDWQSMPRHLQWQKLSAPLQLTSTEVQQLNNNQVFFVFQYPHAPLNELLKVLAQQRQPATILFAADQHELYKQTQQFLKQPISSDDGANRLHPPYTITLIKLPFIHQEHFDKLLWSCDFNIVRGEDSWVRALWAQKPFIWQPYPQAQSTHLQKLNAWLQRLQLPHAPKLLLRQWNQHSAFKINPTALNPSVLQAWRQSLQQEVWRLSAQSSLSERLVSLCKLKSV